MKKLNRLVLPAVVLFFLAGVVGLVNMNAGVSAQELLQDNQEQSEEQEQNAEDTEENQEDEAPENTNEDQNQTENQPAEEAGAYTYVAQPGDSYTLMARKAVQTFGLENNVNLSEAQIIFAETNLTRAADSPRLSVDQEVQIEQSLVREWVEKAQQLSEEDQAEWAVYVEGVDFNTNNVGETS